ncbi:MAG: energy transducer TonB [Novosphingobium sp.]|nr:energy transducer TonB [Novosphingobium sp.]MCP5401121.1 energy transducer TonB [Novosphingobium sp.]
MAIALALAASIGQQMILATPMGDYRDWITIDDLPEEAPQHIEVWIEYRLTVDENGKVTDCRTTDHSFGNVPDLDIYRRLTCELVRERATFRPARNSDFEPALSFFQAGQPWSSVAQGPTVVGVMPSAENWPKNPDGTSKHFRFDEFPKSTFHEGTRRMVLAHQRKPSVRVIAPTQDNNFLRTEDDVRGQALGKFQSLRRGARGAVPRNNPSSWVSIRDLPFDPSLIGQVSRRVTFNLTILRNGRVKGCRIVGTSGLPILDQTTCAFVSARARFKPALNEFGTPVESSYTNVVRWFWKPPSE